MGLNSGFLILTSQAPDQWEPETDDEAEIEQVDKKVVLNLSLTELSFRKSRRIQLVQPLLKNTR